MAASPDELLWHLGRPGRYSIIVCALLFYNYFQVGYNQMAVAFFGADPLGYRCSPVNEISVNTTVYTGFESTDNGSCLQYGSSEVDVANWCAIRENCTSCNTSTPFVMEDREWTTVAQFELVCGRKYLNSLATTIYFLGVLVGAIFFGYCADAYGRQPVMIATVYLSAGVGIGLFFVNSYVLFVILRFIIGFLLQGYQIAAISVLMESFSTKHRGIVICVLIICFEIGVLLLSLSAYFIRDWRWMQLAGSVAASLTIFVVWLFPESLRWLIMKGKYDRAKRLVKKISGYNRQKEVPKAVWTILDDNQKTHEVQRVYHVIHLLKSNVLRIRCVIVWYVWFSLFTGYFVIVLGTGSLAGLKYTNFAIGTGLELAAFVANILILNLLGRRRPLAAYASIGGVSCILCGIIQDATTKTVMSLVGRLTMAGAIGLLFLYVPEMFPTHLRATALGAGTFGSRVGGMVAPQIYLLESLTYPEIPYIICGVLTVVAGALSLILPETLKQELPDTVDEAEQMGWGFCGHKKDYTLDRNKADTTQEIFKF